MSKHCRKDKRGGGVLDSSFDKDLFFSFLFFFSFLLWIFFFKVNYFFLVQTLPRFLFIVWFVEEGFCLDYCENGGGIYQCFFFSCSCLFFHSTDLLLLLYWELFL